ncbi:MAG: formyl transferase [Phycisphaerae bacterium]
MRIGILTSTDTRHRYFVNRVAEALPVVAVGLEQTGYSPSDLSGYDLTREEAKAVVHHFSERTRLETLYFSDHAFVPEGIARLELKPGTLNAPETVTFFSKAGVDLLLVYGTNLVRDPLLSTWQGRIINMHLGLSPYYRGTATNFYPLLNEEPEYVGATIHWLDAGIDSGPILRHARPEIVANDAPHTIGCKAIRAGIETLISVVKALGTGSVPAFPQWKPGNAKLYLRKDYHPRQVHQLYHKLDQGLIPRFVENAANRLAAVRLVESHAFHDRVGVLSAVHS